jgi:predicted RNA-binding protein YlxR (DUF448 family)
LLRIVAAELRSADEHAGVRTYALSDPDAQMPGRGAYLCLGSAAGEPSSDCLQRAARRNALARALRRSIAGSMVSPGAKLVESVDS